MRERVVASLGGEDDFEFWMATLAKLAAYTASEEHQKHGLNQAEADAHHHERYTDDIAGA
jgi:hypothetical protein